MAYMIPETLPKKCTAGERLFFHTLKDHLPDDYIVYYEPEIGGRKPDYVVIGPDLGMLVLEIKDYTESTLYELFPNEWRIYNTQGELNTVKNPLHQARDNAFRIADKLKKDKNLLQTGAFHGHLKFRFGYGVVFTRLKEMHIVKHELHRVIEPQFMLTRDDIDAEDDDVSGDALIERLLGMFTVPFRSEQLLSDADIKAIRYHLFPEVRISAEFKEPVYYNDQLLLSLHNLQAMDLHQESLARQLGDKNRLIRGVAGSGKTLILSARARMLAKDHPHWKILVLCYGISLSCVLRSMIDNMMEEPEDLFDFVQINSEQEDAGKLKKHHIETSTFHEWLWHTMRIKDDAIDNLLQKIDQKEAILPKYDAILIDEGQDFEPAWLELLSKVLNPDTQSLLLVEDKAQNIFKRKTSLAASTGLDFRGRSKILSINYRNTAQIVNFAWDFYRTYSSLRDRVKEGTTVEGVEIIPPQSTKRKGPDPVIQACKSFDEEAAWVAENILKLHREHKVAFSDIAILYRVKNRYSYSYIDQLKKELNKHGIPFNWFAESNATKRSYDRDQATVKISTVDSSKGLDFKAVFIVNVESMPFSLEENVEQEVSRFYIAMTRAMYWLYLSYSKPQGFAAWLLEKSDQTVSLPLQRS
ncbi:3'-5' exonuclease [Paenibacillus sp. GCM10012307]|uniref:AAA family ATPase n=1 Tax=Paenibacillus roseus TaxID=2798579 RepID=A0A934IUT6_9BACL|nr:nuclease-related domain-containing DEAD/DEAH box helicase [Paenibacillus roseus]MBJ6359732.1 AAA family ATPase [Paenibacillus roseus]